MSAILPYISLAFEKASALTHNPNIGEKLGNMMLLPAHYLTSTNYPRVVASIATIALTILTYDLINSLLFPKKANQKKANQSQEGMITIIPGRVRSIISVVASLTILGFGIRTLGRFKNEELVKQFL